MFERQFPPRTIAFPAVVSKRDGWHGTPDLTRQDARLLSLDATMLTADEALSALVALQAHHARLDAIELDLMVRCAGSTRVVRDVLVEADSSSDADPSRSCQRSVTLVDEVVDEIACALRRPFGQLHLQVQYARLLTGPLVRTRDALQSGRITLAHATAIAQQAARMATSNCDLDAGCERLQDRVLPHAHRDTVSQCRSRARRAVASIDAAAESERRRRARLGCDVTAYCIDDGLAIIEARLPLAEAARIIAHLEERTRSLVCDGTTTDPLWLERHALHADAGLGQLRAAAFVDLVTAGEPGAASTAVDVQVVVDAATLCGLDPDGAAWIQVGCGASAAIGRDDLLRLLGAPDTHATLRRLVTDPLTGALVDRGARRYPISASLAAWITARDVTCRFPGCSRRAARCDVDHAEEFDMGGATTIANTGALCRRHHNRKTHAGWRIIDSKPDGSCVFVSPAGRRYPHEAVELVPPPDPPPSPPPAMPVDSPPGF